MGYFYEDDELEHHGIKGQKWGVRRFQNADGSLTSKGKSRYGDTSDLYKAKKSARSQAYKDAKKAYKDEYKKNLKETRSKATLNDKLLYNDATRKRAAKLMTKYKDMSYEKATKTAQKEAIRNTAIVLGAYGAVTIGSLVAANKGKHAYFVKTLEF